MQDMHTTRPEQVISSTSGQLSFLRVYVMPSFQKENLNVATIWLDASISMLASDHTMHKVLHWNTRIFGGIPEHSVNNRIFCKIPNTMKFR